MTLQNRRSSTSLESEFEELYRATYFIVLSIVYKRAPDSDEAWKAEDYVQEIFLRAMLSMKKGTIPKTPKAWIGRIARNLLIDHYLIKERKGPGQPLEAAYQKKDEGQEIRVEETERREQLHRIIEKDMTEDQRTIIRLELQGYQSQEIAEQLNRTRGSVKSILFRAKKVIKNKMEYHD